VATKKLTYQVCCPGLDSLVAAPPVVIDPLVDIDAPFPAAAHKLVLKTADHGTFVTGWKVSARRPFNDGCHES